MHDAIGSVMSPSSHSSPSMLVDYHHLFDDADEENDKMQLALLCPVLELIAAHAVSADGDKGDDDEDNFMMMRMRVMMIMMTGETQRALLCPRPCTPHCPCWLL